MVSGPYSMGINPSFLMNQQANEQIRRILQPLQWGDTTIDYKLQYTKMVEFDQCFKSLETEYANLYVKIQAIETELKKLT